MKLFFSIITTVIVVTTGALYFAPPPSVWSARPLPEPDPWATSSTTAGESSAETESESKQLFRQGLAAVETGDFQRAYDYFWRASRLERNNADIFNMLAYTQRQLGQFEEAFRYYQRALKLRPHFPQAREYLGEAHIQAALLQIQILQSYGPEADHELKDLVAAFRAAAASLPSE